MKDKMILGVTLLEDDVERWIEFRGVRIRAGKILHKISEGILIDYLKEHGESGRDEIQAALNFLKKDVERYYYEQVREG